MLPCEPPGIGTLAKSGTFRGLSCSLGALQQVPGPLDAPRQHQGQLGGKSHVVQWISREQRLGWHVLGPHVPTLNTKFLTSSSDWHQLPDFSPQGTSNTVPPAHGATKPSNPAWLSSGHQHTALPSDCGDEQAVPCPCHATIQCPAEASCQGRAINHPWRGARGC